MTDEILNPMDASTTVQSLERLNAVNMGCAARLAAKIDDAELRDIQHAQREMSAEIVKLRLWIMETHFSHLKPLATT